MLDREYSRVVVVLRLQQSKFLVYRPSKPYTPPKETALRFCYFSSEIYSAFVFTWSRNQSVGSGKQNYTCDSEIITKLQGNNVDLKCNAHPISFSNHQSKHLRTIIKCLFRKPGAFLVNFLLQDSSWNQLHSLLIFRRLPTARHRVIFNQMKTSINDPQTDHRQQ